MFLVMKNSPAFDQQSVERNCYIDLLRGMAILIVIFGHVLQYCNEGAPTTLLHRIIMTFQMPLMFAISGYVADLGAKNGLKEDVCKKIRRLLVPYFFGSSCVFFVETFKFERTLNIQNYLHELCCSQFWFLRVLFLVFVVFEIGRILFAVAERSDLGVLWYGLSIIIWGVCMIVVGFIPGQTSFAHYFPFFFAGLYGLSCSQQSE